jgi:long-chain acyl-CoA synthetase
MNITDLKQYKEKLSKLNKLEEKQRDLYLRKLSLGELQGPVTGYPTVDKPWYKYMSEENVIKDIPVKNVYQELYDNNKDYLDQTALIYFGAKISFRKFFENIDKTAKAFVVNGIKKGDFVTISSALNPETLYAFYALAKIGAVSNFMAPFFDKQGLIDRIADCDSKIAIIMDTFYDELIESINKSNIEKVVILPTLNSSPVRLLKKVKIFLHLNV